MTSSNLPTAFKGNKIWTKDLNKKEFTLLTFPLQFFLLNYFFV